MALEVWETLKESITAYTGLSPATFFTVVVLSLVTYYVVSEYFFVSSSDHLAHHQSSRDFEEMEPLPPPVQLGEITEQDLKEYDGSDPKKPLLMAIKSQIYDVSQSRVFYGPGGPYALFAGKDASRALAKMSFDEKDLTGDISGLGVFELEALQDWEYKFMSKYVKVGTVKTSVPVTEATTNGETSEAAEAEATTNGELSQAAADAEVSKSDEASEQDAAKPAEANERDVPKLIEPIDHDGAKPAEESPSPSETASNGNIVVTTSFVADDKKE